jgi:hypothetical protein
MEEDRFDEVVRGLPRSFKVPPEPPLDEMWSVIEDAHFNAAPMAARRGITSRLPWLAVAATLLVGIGIGYYLLPGKDDTGLNSAQSVAAAGQATTGDTTTVAEAYRDQTSQYLGQAAALLISLPAEGAADRSDARFAGKAADLLVTTRLLMDSPAAQDPKLRGLLEDLELVLVQIARLRVERNRSDLDLIHQTVEQGDVISRLNSVVATNQSAE